MVVTLTDANFDEMVLKADKPVLVDFWAEWCGPCRVIGPLVSEIAEDYKDKVIVGKLDVDSNPEVSAKYGIRNIPTVLFFKNGQVADKQVGAVPKGNLVNKVEALIIRCATINLNMLLKYFNSNRISVIVLITLLPVVYWIPSLFQGNFQSYSRTCRCSFGKADYLL